MISEEDKKGFEDLAKKAIENQPSKANPITHHGEGDIVFHAIHTGEGDIYNNMAELKKLRTKVEMLEEIIDLKEDCVKIHMKDYKALIDVKNEEVQILKGAIKSLNNTIKTLSLELQRYSPSND